MTKSKAIRRLLEVAPAILESWSKANTGRGRCIFSTAVGIKVLAEFGITAAPLPVRCKAWNRAWAELPPAPTVDQMNAAGAWSVLIGPGLPGMPAPVDDGPGGWDGHLIILAGRLAIDLNSGAMNRPLKGLPVPEALTFPWFDNGTTGGDEDSGVGFWYEPIEDQSFTTAKDWTANHAPMVAEIVRAIRKGEHRG